GLHRGDLRRFRRQLTACSPGVGGLDRVGGVCLGLHRGRLGCRRCCRLLRLGLLTGDVGASGRVGGAGAVAGRRGSTNRFGRTVGAGTVDCLARTIVGEEVSPFRCYQGGVFLIFGELLFDEPFVSAEGLRAQRGVDGGLLGHSGIALFHNDGWSGCDTSLSDVTVRTPTEAPRITSLFGSSGADRCRGSRGGQSQVSDRALGSRLSVWLSTRAAPARRPAAPPARNGQMVPGPSPAA